MNKREHITALVAGKVVPHCGFWLGNPDAASWPGLMEHFGASSPAQLRRLVGDDFGWVYPTPAYNHPQGRGIFDMTRSSNSLSAAGPFADCEDVAEIEDYEWPNPAYLDFQSTLDALRSSGDLYRASGMWAPFFHDVANYFGMENYFIKMYTNPDVVDAVTRHVCEFYLAANEILFDEAGDEIDGMFFGNDLGTQRDLMIGLAQFDRFLYPWIQAICDQAHARGYQVLMHSCGAVAKLIDRYIGAGVNALHPLQALAHGMDAESLARDFGGRVAFIGGIDAQGLLVRGTPDEVKQEVRRVRGLLGPNVIISPSHEAILPDVPPQNVRAMAEAAHE